tara:strand:+ start:167 stop:1048 length:882 start_codon:yes stop_codon:yes gene_type:complete
MSLRYCNVFSHGVQGFPIGSTTNWNANGDINSNTMARSVAMVIRPFKDSTHPLNGDEGFFFIRAEDLNFSGWNGTMMGNWIDYGTNADGTWNSTVSPNAGCPLNQTEFAPLKDSTNMGDATQLGEILNNDIGHTFWRNNLGANGNWDMFENNVVGQDVFDTTLTEGYEPTPGIPGTHYKSWSKAAADVLCVNEENSVQFGNISEDFCSNWPPHVKNIIAVNTRDLTSANNDVLRNNSIFIIATFVDGFDWNMIVDEIPQVSGGDIPESYVVSEQNDWVSFNLDIRGEANWRAI